VVRRIGLLAALTIMGAVLLAGTGTAKKKNPCQAKHEKAGCTLKNARYTGVKLSFSVNSGSGVAGGFATITCDGHPRNVLYGNYPELVIRNPKVGHSYTRRRNIQSPQGQFPVQTGRLIVTVTITSASRTTVKFDNSFSEDDKRGNIGHCAGISTEKLKRA
jgi:hypothetical protein